jgi:Zn finger protein HypA/HybF involved in hydrogenase expression
MIKVKCEKIPKTKQFLTTETFIERVILLHGNKYDYSKLEYKKWDEKVEIICIQHGIFWQKASAHLKGNGCPKCGRISTTIKNTLIQTSFLEKAIKIHGNAYDYSKVIYKNSRTEVEIICPKHGSFWQPPNSHRKKGCPRCRGSISKVSQRWLDYLKVPKMIGTNREVIINIDNNNFRVDGYDSQTNTIYEFHGDWWHGNPKLYNLEDIHPINKKTYGELLENTQKRSRLLKSHGYNVVSIWESDWKKIEKELKKGET